MDDSRTLAALQVSIPVDGVWFDRGEELNGIAWRMYWRNGAPVVTAKAFEHHDSLLGGTVWLVTVAWAASDKDPAEHTFGPYRERVTAVAMVDAVGIGVQAVVEAQHISLIPGAAAITRGRD
jgi:hypothetical protein